MDRKAGAASLMRGWWQHRAEASKHLFWGKWLVGGLFGLWGGLGAAVGGAPHASFAESSLPMMNLSQIEQTETLAETSFLYDDHDSYTAADLARREHTNIFQTEITSSKEIYSAGSLWLRLALYNDHPHTMELVLYALPTHHMFDVHELKPAGGILSSTAAGASVPRDERPLYSRYPAVLVRLEPLQRKDFLVHMKSNDVLKPQVMLAEKDKFFRQDGIKNTLIPLYYGLMMAMILYNLFLFVTIRDRSYLYYILFASAFCLNLGSLDGFADLFLGQWNFGSWSRFYPHISLASILFVNIFVSNLLDFARKEPLIYRAAVGLNILVILMFAGQAWGGIHLLTYVDLLLLFLACLYMVIGVKQWRQGSKPAKFFSIAWTTLLLTIALAVIIPHLFNVKQESIYVNLYVGSAIEVLLMSFALASRITGLQNEKMEAVIKAQEAERLQNLVRVVCHDISTPLAIINGNAQWAIEQDSFCSEVMLARWKKVEKAVRVTSDILNSVKYMESLRSGKMQLVLEPVSLKEAFVQAQFIFDKELAHKDLKMVSRLFETGSRDVFVLAEKISFYNQVIANLISNAIKFSYHGQRIEVNVVEEGEWCILEITDFGAGIATQAKHSLFSSQQPTSSLGTLGELGTGFGLPIVKSFVEMAGGRIEVESRQKIADNAEHGTTFRLFLRRVAS